jgi:tRNA threonylcarbamoyladenosine biosynthesis protein TsaB
MQGRPDPVSVALETSSRRPSVAVQRASRVEERWLDGNRPHASDLLPALRQLLPEVGAAPSDIAQVFVGTGPGSYTGLRVGIATALGLARARGATILGVGSGDVLAHAELRPGECASLVLNAYRNEFFFARYRREEQDVATLSAPMVLAPDELAARVESLDWILCDQDTLVALPESSRARLRAGCAPSARALLELAQTRLTRSGPMPPESIEPLYLRAFAAAQRRR